MTVSAWEDISSSYAEAAAQAFPLQRAAVFAVAFLASLAIQQQTHLSVLETLAVLPLSEFTTLEKGFLAKSSAGNVLWALLATLLAVVVSWLFSRLAYSLVDKATGATARAKAADKSWLSELSIDDRKAALEIVESGLIEPRTRLRSLVSTNELLSGVAVVLLTAGYWGNVLDYAVGTSALVCAFFSHALSIKIFLTEYYAAALAKSQLQGKLPPLIGKVN